MQTASLTPNGDGVRLSILVLPGKYSPRLKELLKKCTDLVDQKNNGGMIDEDYYKGLLNEIVEVKNGGL